MTKTLLTALLLTACGTDVSDPGVDASTGHTDKPLCQPINDDMTYLNEYPIAQCTIDLSTVDYHLFANPLDPGAEPRPFFLSGWERAMELPGNPLVQATSAPVVHLRDDIYNASAVLHGGMRGRAVVLDEKVERCEWVRCR